MTSQESELGQNNTDPNNGPWETPLTRNEEGEPIGVTLALMTEDLRAMNIDVDATNTVYYKICDGVIKLNDSLNKIE